MPPALGGDIHLTAGSQMTSETHTLGVNEYRHQRWGRGGGFGVMMYRESTNELRQVRPRGDCKATMGRSVPMTMRARTVSEA